MKLKLLILLSFLYLSPCVIFVYGVKVSYTKMINGSFTNFVYYISIFYTNMINEGKTLKYAS